MAVQGAAINDKKKTAEATASRMHLFVGTDC